jgi:peroxiredoxin Q/BCP
VIEPGQPAPAFTLPDQDGTPVSLSDYAGQTVVVYFYPRAGTPGCTTQAQGVRDTLPDYTAAGAAVVGVSPDGVEAVKAFHDAESLTFPLLADEDHAVTDAYGAWGERSMYGNTYMGVIRTTYIVGPDGNVTHVFPKIQPKKHDKAVLKALSELAAA